MFFLILSSFCGYICQCTFSNQVGVLDTLNLGDIITGHWHKDDTR